MYRTNDYRRDKTSAARARKKSILSLMGFNPEDTYRLHRIKQQAVRHNKHLTTKDLMEECLDEEEEIAAIAS